MSDSPEHLKYVGDSEAVKVSLKSRTVGCANSKWIVYFDHIVDEQGNEVVDYIVVGGVVRRPDKITGVCVLPIVDGRIGLIHYFRHAIEEALWEAPRGFVDEGEEPATAALRELKEETGLTCIPSDLLQLGYYLPEPSTLQARGGVFVARRCTGRLSSLDREIGLGRFSLFTPSEVMEMMQHSEIQDASTLIAIYRYFVWCQERDEKK